MNLTDGQLTAWSFFGPTNSTGRREYFHSDHLHVVSGPGNTFYVAGTITGGLLPGSDAPGIFFVSRIDRNLNVLWTQQFGPSQLNCIAQNGVEVLEHSGPLSTEGMSSGAVMTSAVGIQHGIGLIRTDIVVLARLGQVDFVSGATYSIRRFNQDGVAGVANLNLASSINSRISGRLMHSSANILTLWPINERIIVSGTSVQSETTGTAGGDGDLPRGRFLVELGGNQLSPIAHVQVQTELHSNLFWLRTGEVLNLYRNPMSGKLQSIVTPVTRISMSTENAIAPQITGFVSFSWPNWASGAIRETPEMTTPETPETPEHEVAPPESEETTPEEIL